MKLRYVSITGADDAVSIADLNALGAAFPFVEWAILFMPEAAGTSRAPSQEWIRDFAAGYTGAHKAMHLCGEALTGFAAGRADVLAMMRGFPRIQLNLEFGDMEGRYAPADILARIAAHPEHIFIIQYTDKRRSWLPELAALPNHAILFDASAGRGVAPAGWPAPLPGHMCGYAGGINPDNIAAHLQKIAAAGATDTWIDMESGVRTDDRFDLGKVRAVLEAAAPLAAG